MPKGTLTSDFNLDTLNVKRGVRVEGTSDLQDWFNGPSSQEIVEEVVGLGGYGKTLTVLTGIEPPDEFGDDEDGIEEDWTPSFGR